VKEKNTYISKEILFYKERWVVEKGQKLMMVQQIQKAVFILYEKKVENYLGLVHLSYSIIIYRKIILG